MLVLAQASPSRIIARAVVAERALGSAGAGAGATPAAAARALAMSLAEHPVSLNATLLRGAVSDSAGTSFAYSPMCIQFTSAGIEWCHCHRVVSMARPHEEPHHSGRAEP